MAIESIGLPLDVYTKATLPGWKPGIAHFLFRRYLERLKLWSHMTDLQAGQLGPAVAGRLQGRLFNLAMVMKSALG